MDLFALGAVNVNYGSEKQLLEFIEEKSVEGL